MTRKNRSPLPRPTDAELGILRTLWRIGPATVRQVNDALEGRSEGYTTTLKLMQIMHQKGLVSRDESQRAHVYTPIVEKVAAQEQLVGDLVQRIFDGSRSQLVLQALGSGANASPEELRRIRQLLDKLEQKSGEDDRNSDDE